jgi:RNA polymerase sigma-70 factor (ECF subfamily)
MARPFDPESLVEHRAFMRSLARGLLADEHRAEDVVQEASLAALRSPPRDPEATRPWLGRVVRNFALRARRREAERPAREEHAARAEATPDPERELEVLVRVADALRALPEPYRGTVYLRYYKDLGPRAIAEREGVSPETVKTRLRRGIDLLRRSLDARCGDRRSWALALASFARPLLPAPAPPPAAPAPGASSAAASATALLEGVLTMKIAALLAVTAAAALTALWLARSVNAPTPTALGAGAPATTPAEPSTPSSAAVAAPAALATTERLEVAVPVPSAEVSSAPRSVRLRVVDEFGEPVGGAEASLPALELLGTSDAAGRVELPLQGAAGTLESALVVSCEGFLTTTARTTLEGTGARDLGDVRIVRAGLVRGRVVDSGGEGVEGALVFTAETGERPTTYVANVLGRKSAPGAARAHATTDALGAFELAGVRPGVQRVWAGLPGGLSYGASAVVEVVGGRTTEDVLLRLAAPPGAGTIAGYVLLPVEVEAKELQVWARHVSPEGVRARTATVAPDGGFRIAVEDAVPHDLWVAEGLGQWDDERHVFTGELALAGWRGVVERDVAPGTHDVALRLERAPGFSVHASDAAGGVIESFELGITAYAGRDLRIEMPWATRARDGQRFSAPASAFMVSVAAEGYTREWLGPYQPTGVPDRVEAVLEPLPFVAGSVVDPDGRSVSGARVQLLRAMPSTARIVSAGMRLRTNTTASAVGVTDAEGRFALTLRSTGDFFVQTSAPGWAPSLTGPLMLDHERGTDDLALALARGGVIEGSVRVAPGASTTGVLVGATNGAPPGHKVVVGADGRFRFEGLAPGEWRVVRLKEDTDVSTVRNNREPLEWESNCTVEDGRTTHFDLDLGHESACTLEGVLALDGESTHGWRASLNAWAPEGPIETEDVDGTTVDGTGAFTLVAPAPGSYYLLLERDDPSRRMIFFDTVELVEGVTPWLREVSLGTVEGRIDTTAFEPGGFVLTTTSGGFTTLALVQPEEDGAFLASDVPAGAAELRHTAMPPTIRDPRDWPVVRELRIRAGSRTALTVE